MKRYQSGMWVGQGYYLNGETWEIQAVPRRGRVLPGAKDITYIRIPVHPVIMAPVGVFLGGLYVVLIPFVAFPFLFWLLTVRVWKMLFVDKPPPVERKREV